MSLTTQDLDQIRTVLIDAINESFEVLSAPRFDQLESQMEGIIATQNKHSATLAEHSTVLAEHSTVLAEHSATLARHSAMFGEYSSTLSGHGRQLTNIETTVQNIDGRLQAIEADVKELYRMYGKNTDIGSPAYAKLPAESKVRRLNSAVRTLAKQLNIQL